MRIYKLLLFLSLFLFLFTLVFTTSIDFNQDMGRHIKLAEIILRTGSVPSVNLFSYTNPDFPFINHHWLSEIIFYFFVTYVGVTSLVFLKVIVFFIALLITFFSSLKKSTFLTASISFLLFIPLLLERSDVRPEIFGFVFFCQSYLHFPSLSNT